MRLKNDDGRFNRTTKIIGTVCAVGALLLSFGTATIKVSKANAWKEDIILVEQKTGELIKKMLEKQQRDNCREIIQELNRLRSKERLEGLSEYDLVYRDQLISDKEQECS